jgi:glycosyltransferase involved in cell wall biosynthesis
MLEADSGQMRVTVARKTEHPLHVGLAYDHWHLDSPPTKRSDAMSIIGYEHARRLAKEATVTLYRPGRIFEPPTASYEGVTYRRVGNTVDRIINFGLRAKQRLLKAIGRFDPTRPMVASRLSFAGYATTVALDSRLRGCDIVHLYIYHQHVPLIRRLNPRAKLILNVHDHAQLQRDHVRTARDLRQVDLIVSASHFMTESMVAAFPEVADRCVTVQNGVDTYDFDRDHDDHDEPLILFVGRMSPEKGVHRLLEAFEKVTTKVPEARLVMIGPASLAGQELVDRDGKDPLFDDVREFWGSPKRFRDHLVAEAESRTPGKVTFIGGVDHSELEEWYRRADIFVFPPIWHEPFGMPPTEAMSAGLPVVGTRSGALPEIVVEGETGLLVERGDVDELAQALLELLEDPDKRKRLGAAGRKRALEQFNWDRHTNEWLEVYEKLLGT